MIKERNKFTVSGNHKIKEIDHLNSVSEVSSLDGNPVDMIMNVVVKLFTAVTEKNELPLLSTVYFLNPQVASKKKDG